MHSTDEAARIPGAHATVETTVAPVAPAATGMPVALVVATAASATAGLIHGVASGTHSDDRTLAWLFAVCAVAQLAWAGVAALRPSRAVLLAGALLNGGALVVWGLTRTVGIGFVDSLAGTEAVTTPDLIAALLAGASLLGVLALVGAHDRLPRISPVWAGLLAAVVLATGAPAMTAGHTHGGHGDEGAHAHAEGDDHAHADGAAHAHEDGEDHAHDPSDPAHAHADGEDHAHDPSDPAHLHADGEDHAHDPSDPAHAHADGEDHAHDPSDPSHAHDPSDPTHAHDPADPTHPHDPADPTHPHDPADPTHPHDPADPTHPHDPADPTHPHDPADQGPIISVDDSRLTDAQRRAAISLIDVTRTGMARFTDVASVRAAGYTSIGDASTGYEHFVHFGFLNDNHLMNPDRIESVVFQVNPDGSKVLVSAMYILSQGMTMADVPDIAGPLTTWHDHQDLCWSVNGSGNPIVVAIRPPGGSCPPGSIFVPTPPMLHVWIVEHPCGPFAGIETDGAQGPHGTSCLHEH